MSFFVPLPCWIITEYQQKNEITVYAFKARSWQTCVSSTLVPSITSFRESYLPCSKSISSPCGKDCVTRNWNLTINSQDQYSTVLLSHLGNRSSSLCWRWLQAFRWLQLQPAYEWTNQSQVSITQPTYTWISNPQKLKNNNCALLSSVAKFDGNLLYSNR